MKFSAPTINWILLLSLVLLWGTSFLFTAIAVATIDPVSLVFLRVVIGAAILWIGLWWRGEKLPRTFRSWLTFALFGFVGYLLPFVLIAWGQRTIDSGLAGMIMAIMPLITMILAHYFIAGERLNRFKVMGFVLGISGVTLLLGPVFQATTLEFLSALAVLVAAASYAVNSVLVRVLPPFEPRIAAAGVLIAASITLLPIWLVQPGSDWSQVALASWVAAIWLGVGPTGIATIILFAVIERAGPTFLSTINYLIPVVAFLSGAWFLHEPLSWSSIIALAIILAGIALTRFRASHNARENL